MANTIINPIIINGIEMPMHSSYVFERKKIYLTEPERTNSLKMTFGEKGFVPYFTISWNYLKMQDYNTIMQYFQLDEVTVKYYDCFSNEYLTAKFAIQQPNYNQLYSKPKILSKNTFDGVLGLELVFDGTMNELDTIDISFDANGASGTVPTTKVGIIGDETTLPTTTNLTYAGKRLVGWSTISNWDITSNENNGTFYNLGDSISFTNNLTLYAIWVNNSSYVLSFDYQNAKLQQQDLVDYYSKNVTYGTAVGTLPIIAIVPVVYNNNNYYPYYTSAEDTISQRWNALSNGSGTIYTSSTIYSVQGNKTIYAYLKPKQYIITFNKNSDSAVVYPSTYTADYNSSISQPVAQNGTKTLMGWYTDEALENKFTFNTMPPTDITLWAKWSD